MPFIPANVSRFTQGYLDSLCLRCGERQRSPRGWLACTNQCIHCDDTQHHPRLPCLTAGSQWYLDHGAMLLDGWRSHTVSYLEGLGIDWKAMSDDQKWTEENKLRVEGEVAMRTEPLPAEERYPQGPLMEHSSFAQSSPLEAALIDGAELRSSNNHATNAGGGYNAAVVQSRYEHEALVRNRERAKSIERAETQRRWEERQHQTQKRAATLAPAIGLEGEIIRSRRLRRRQ